MEETAKRPLPYDPLNERNRLAFNARGSKPERGLLIAPCQSFKDLRRSREIASGAGVGDRIDRALEPGPRHIAHGPQWGQGQMGQLMHLIRKRRHIKPQAAIRYKSLPPVSF